MQRMKAQKIRQKKIVVGREGNVSWSQGELEYKQLIIAAIHIHTYLVISF